MWFVFMVYWVEAYSDSCQTSEMELFAKLVNNWKLLTFSQKLHLIRLTVFWIRHSWIKIKLLGQVLLHIAIWNDMYLLSICNYTPTWNAKRLRFSQTPMPRPEYIIFGRMKIWKTLRRLGATTKRIFGKWTCLRMLRNLAQPTHYVNLK